MTTTAATAPTGRGKLTPERERELLRITLELVAEVGYDHVTMATVAKRAKCSTATLYRQWESKPRLVITAWKAYDDERRSTLAEVDTGTLRGDLLEVAQYLADEDPAQESLISVVQAVVRDQELMPLLREIMIRPVLEDLDRILRRAVARGEAAPDSPALRMAEHLLYGPALVETILHGRQPTRAFLTGFVDDILLPVLTRRGDAL
ncbi:TetR/AcrR family transcriptional regulator [Kitasatospora sp. NBC_01287]|uniref:TetR/AcrR family transcriptional regulator n=1 Tax=Kitasatospora sp. NBC_01287 TaxID=2903573 RepID=UPI0022586D57|nr:TetR/AcrR family transcriptional regulator [Kitasatospora sp. NBC_01287]MCX4745866.1 TetR/AcrR family transcriptional regulator [Kitasatospora sp. NBC_01287]